MLQHVIVWFRKDLRIQDNPALAEAAASGKPVLPVFIQAPQEEGEWAPGGASRWWQHHALTSLDYKLREAGNHLIVHEGDSLEILKQIASDHDVTDVYWNRRYEPASLERDADVRAGLKGEDIEVHDFNGSLIWEPHQVRKPNGEPYKVFTPFWKQARQMPVATVKHASRDGLARDTGLVEGESLDTLGLLPRFGWDGQFYDAWTPTLDGARYALESFSEEKIKGYTKLRDCPGVDGTSRLSPFLHFGQLSPRQVWHAIHASGAADTNDGFKFLSEIAWREFAHHLLFHYPRTPTQPLNDSFGDFPWQDDAEMLDAWRKGQTGYPIVDAGMRQLWRTGWMHNRVRMVAASLLVKHLLQPWQAGARWFWETLVDADLANNTMGWQWTAGCGADAAPYFRIFNPMLQGAKFDPNGDYVRAWVPELAGLPDKHIHAPWEASKAVLSEAGVTLGQTYPEPIVEHRLGRERALAALQENTQRNRAKVNV